MKDIEYLVKNATNTWRNVFHLHKLSEYPMEIKDNDDDESDKDEDNKEDSTQFVMVDYQELMKDDDEEDEERDLVKIVATVISSFPQFLEKLVTSSS